MDKTISVRIDEAVANKIGALAIRLNMSKGRIIERAVELYAAQIDKEQEHDVFEQTCGAWSREESAEELVEMARKAFRGLGRIFQT